MKGNDNIIFWAIITIALLCGLMVNPCYYNDYASLITFLSIMIGFKSTAFAVLFVSPLKKALYDTPVKKYDTELHRIKDIYKHSLYFEVVSVALLFVVPDLRYDFCKIIIGKHLLVFPILAGTIYCFYKIASNLFDIFVHPTND